MADSTLFKPVEINFKPRKRGDTKPYRFLRKVNGAPLDNTGYTYVMTGNLQSSPVDDTAPPQVFQLTTTGDGVAGTFTFVPTATDVDFLGKVYYDIQEKDAGGKLLTVVEGYILFDQDIGKTT